MATMTITAQKIADDVDADLGHFAAELEIPVLAGLQSQGDLVVIPIERPLAGLSDLAPLPRGGETLLTGRNGHAHVLAGEGIGWDPSSGQTLGTLSVPRGRVAYLFHSDPGGRRFAEHAPNAIAPGTYVIRRQREMTQTSALLAD